MKRFAALFLSLCLLLAGCGSAAPSDESRVSRTVYAMDTVMTLTAYGSRAEAALDAAEAELYRLDGLLSISSENGDVARLNREQTVTVSPETARLLRRALDIAGETGGAYDPTVYPLVDLWGFYGDGEQRVPDRAAIDEALGQVDYACLSVEGAQAEILPPAARIDLGGIAKGHAAERVLAVMEEAGAAAAVISLGGNVGTLGQKPDGSPWTVAVEDPDRSGAFAATLSLAGGLYAVTSGGYERYFEQDGVRYHHILDPATGYPAASDLKSVTVISADGTRADGLSTALFILGFDGAVTFWRAHPGEFGLVLVTAEGLYATPDLDISSDRTVTLLEAAS